MDSPFRSVPSYRLHRQSGQAVVTLPDPTGRRRDVLLGRYGSEESRAEYTRVIAAWQSSSGRVPTPRPSRADLTAAELAVRFLDHAAAYYRHPDGRPTGEVDGYKLSLRPLCELHGATVAAEFGPLALKTVRQRMVDAGVSRKVVNQRVGRIVRVFKWAVGEELLPATVYQALRAVGGLAAGRTRARETAPVVPVPEADVAAVRPFVRPGVWAMVRVQLLAGMRPGEVCRMRAEDVDRSGPVWVYRPVSHKTAWRGKARAVLLGPRAQEVLAPYLAATPTGWLFSPKREMAALRQAQRATRKTPPRAAGRPTRTVRPRRVPGPHYTPHAYAVAVARGCARAGVPHWHPNQLRHTAATAIRQAYGLEAAQAVLGHARADVTQVYAERDRAVAERVALQLG